MTRTKSAFFPNLMVAVLQSVAPAGLLFATLVIGGIAMGLDAKGDDVYLMGLFVGAYSLPGMLLERMWELQNTLGYKTAWRGYFLLLLIYWANRALIPTEAQFFSGVMLGLTVLAIGIYLALRPHLGKPGFQVVGWLAWVSMGIFYMVAHPV